MPEAANPTRNAAFIASSLVFMTNPKKKAGRPLVTLPADNPHEETGAASE